MTLRFAVVGCGTITQRAHLPDLSANGCEVTVFAGRTLESASAAAEIWGSGDVSDDWATAVTRGDVDAVLVCTPNNLHAPVALAAAAAGKHVLVEKPMAPTLAAADAMVAACADAGVTLMTAHNMRLMAPFAAFASAVASGAVGRVTEVHAHFGHAGPQAWAPDATWFRDPAVSGGGALVDLGIHVADLIRAVSGLSVSDVTAVLASSGGVEESASVALRFEGGAIGSMRASWQSVPGPDFGLTVQGTTGRLHLDPRTPLTLFPANGEAPSEVALSDGTTVVAAFLGAVAGTSTPISAGDGRAAVAVVEAAYRAAGSGRSEPVG